LIHSVGLPPVWSGYPLNSGPGKAQHFESGIVATTIKHEMLMGRMALADEKFEKIDEKFEKIDERFKTLET
jgi:hypothetical protein